MQILIQIAAVIGGVLLAAGVAIVALAALFPPKEWKGEALPNNNNELEGA